MEKSYDPSSEPSPAVKKGREGLDFMECFAVGAGAILGLAGAHMIPPEALASLGKKLTDVLSDAPQVITNIISNAETVKLIAEISAGLIGAKVVHDGYLKLGRILGLYKEKPKKSNT